MKHTFLSIAFIIFTALSVCAQKISFTSDIDEMLPMSYPAQSGLSDFSFDMSNDTAYVRLPYIGEVYNPTFNNDGLNFTEHCTDITVTPTKKNDGREIKFTLKHDIVIYRFAVTLWDSNRIDIYMQPSNAQSCNYMGEWKAAIKREESKLVYYPEREQARPKVKSAIEQEKSKLAYYPEREQARPKVKNEERKTKKKTKTKTNK